MAALSNIFAMDLYFKIADVSILCRTPFVVNDSSQTSDFRIQPCEAEMEFRFIPVKSLQSPAAGGVWMADSCYTTYECGTTTYHYANRNELPYCRVIYQYEQPHYLCCEYLAGHENLMKSSNNIMHLLELESFLLHGNTLLLHASFIRSRGRGILFSGPSGIGKSTQAALWQSFMGAEVLNGDRAGLRKTDEGWTAFGLPYAGTSGICRNESASITAIVILRQYSQNRLSILSKKTAFSLLYPELTVHRWDPHFVNRAVDLLLNLLESVPVYLLECLPDEDAVRTLEKKLTERGE